MARDTAAEWTPEASASVSWSWRSEATSSRRTVATSGSRLRVYAWIQEVTRRSAAARAVDQARSPAPVTW